MPATVPRIALLLGCAGLLPFAAGALGVWIAPPGWRDFARTATMTYAGVALAFLGGVHWGAAIKDSVRPNETQITWSVMPVLVGWAAPFAGSRIGLPVLALAFGLAWWVDDRACRRGALPIWYLPLRAALTVGVLVCLAAIWIRLR